MVPGLSPDGARAGRAAPAHGVPAGSAAAAALPQDRHATRPGAGQGRAGRHLAAGRRAPRRGATSASRSARSRRCRSGRRSPRRCWRGRSPLPTWQNGRPRPFSGTSIRGMACVRPPRTGGRPRRASCGASSSTPLGRRRGSRRGGSGGSGAEFQQVRCWESGASCSTFLPKCPFAANPVRGLAILSSWAAENARRGVPARRRDRRLGRRVSAVDPSRSVRRRAPASPARIPRA